MTVECAEGNLNFSVFSSHIEHRIYPKKYTTLNRVEQDTKKRKFALEQRNLNFNEKIIIM